MVACFLKSCHRFLQKSQASSRDPNHRFRTSAPALLLMEPALSPDWATAVPPGGPKMEAMHTIPARGGLNYDETPFLAIWEITQSCDLACKHCRAAAQPIAHPEQLSTEEGKAL